MVKPGRPAPAEKDMIITTVSLDPKTHRRLKHLAVDEGIALRELIRRAVSEYVKRRRERKS